MTLDALRKLIATGEGETLEFKATTGQREDACETLCGYLNKDGGTVIFGVTRKGELTGQLVSDKTKRELFEVFAKFEPSADEVRATFESCKEFVVSSGDKSPEEND